MNPIAIFRLPQIPASYRSPSTKSAVAQIVNRTKMFHVKHFGTIGPRTRTKTTFRRGPPWRGMEITGEGLVLGAGTRLARTARVAGTEDHPANRRKTKAEHTRFLLGVERVSRRNRARGEKNSGRPWGDKGGRSGYPFRADWLGLDRRGTATGKARRHRAPWLDDSRFDARSLDPNVLPPREGPVNFWRWVFLR